MKRCIILIFCMLFMVFAHADGAPLEARMDRAVWPVGAEVLGFTLTVPGGGIRYYDVPGDIDRLESGWWEPVAAAYDYCGGHQFDDWEAEARTGVKELRGFLGGSVHLNLPLRALEPLSPGKYRLCWGETGEADEREKQYIEFEVSADALPVMPAAEDEPVFSAPEHIPDHLDADYDSCQDNSRWIRDSALIQLGDTVMEWRGFYSSEGSWFPDRYWLFSYPAGRREQARLVRGDMEIDLSSVCDTGTGWLIRDCFGEYFRADYDGGNMVSLGEKDTRSALPAGGMLYYTREDGLWRAPMDTMVPEHIYTADLTGDDAPEDWDADADMDVTLICHGGTLYFADRGIMALDMETLATRRITDRLYNDAGDAGYAFFILNDRLYACLDRDEGMVSMDLDGGDVQKVSDDVYYVSQLSGGIVLACKGRTTGGFSGGYESAAFYLPDDPGNPVFDPDHCRRREIDDYDFILGDWLYHRTTSGAYEIAPVTTLLQS